MEIFGWMYVLLFVIWGISANMRESAGRKFSCVGSFLVLWLIQALRSTSTGTDLKASQGSTPILLQTKIAGWWYDLMLVKLPCVSGPAKRAHLPLFSCSGRYRL